MEVGVFIPHIGSLASPELVTAFCRGAESAGFDGLWVAEHLAVPQQMSSRYPLPRRPAAVTSQALQNTMGLNLEPLTTLAVAAAVTSRVTLGTSVAVLPLHNPILNARQLATIDLHSGGRLVYGVGVGWLREEALAMGMPWDRRGERAEEHIAVLRALWSGSQQPVSHRGRFYSFAPIDSNPVPTQLIPILIGGHSPIAYDRAARIGDGWIAAKMSPGRLRSELLALRRACDQHRRNPEELRVACTVGIEANNGDTDSSVTLLQQYAALGVTHLQVRMQAPSGTALLEALSIWGENVLPNVEKTRRPQRDPHTRSNPCST